MSEHHQGIDERMSATRGAQRDGKLRPAPDRLPAPIPERRQAGAFRAQAVKCRRLAASIGDARASDTLERMAKEYDEKAIALDRIEPVD